MLEWRKAMDLCKLICTLLKFVHFQNNFSGRIFVPLMYSITSSADRNGLTFLPALLLFCVYSFSSLTNSTNTLSTIWKTSRDSGHPCLIPNFSGITSSFSPFRMMWAALTWCWGMFLLALYSFIMKSWGNLSKAFSIF